MIHKKTFSIVGVILVALFLSVYRQPVTASHLAPTDGEFTDIHAGLKEAFYSSTAWGDYDGDGDLDVLITGSRLALVYRNDNGTFTDLNAGLTGVNDSSGDWGDYDNDGDLDILITGESLTGGITKIYRNDGGVFADIQIGLPGVRKGSGVWGDYDHDGRLEIVLSGYAGPEIITRIYRNNGNNSFVDINAHLMAVYESSAAWGDFDSDGDLDLAMSGVGADGTDIYRNDGGAFTRLTIMPDGTGVWWGSVAWGDYDNDGDLDLLMNGYVPGDNPKLYLFRNEGGSFTRIYLGAIGGTYHGNAAWGDYNNDGNLDIAIVGNKSLGYLPYAGIWRNDGNNGFTDITAGLPGLKDGSITWGDYDNDGRLDIVLVGEVNYPDGIGTIFRNTTAITNTIPTPPTGLTASTKGSTATLSWGEGSDGQTSSTGLTYNLRIGTTPGGINLLSPMSDPASGYRYIPKLGNMNQAREITIHGLMPATTYYWSVQSVDSAFAGSSFASEGSFETYHYAVFIPVAIRK
jgi:hypothetical protein